MLNNGVEKVRRCQDFYPLMSWFLFFFYQHDTMEYLQEWDGLVCVCVCEPVQTHSLLSSRTSVSNRGRPDDVLSAEASAWNFHGANDGHQLPKVCGKRRQHLAPPFCPVKSGQAVEGGKNISLFSFCFIQTRVSCSTLLAKGTRVTSLSGSTEMTCTDRLEKRLETKQNKTKSLTQSEINCEVLMHKFRY